MNKVALCTIVAALTVPPALGQENPFLRGRYTPVPERDQPEFDPVPLRAGSFFVDSSLGVGAEYNDNIYAQDTPTTEDTILTLNPTAELYSSWSVHALGAGVNVNHREYTEESSESVTDYSAFANGRLDITRNAFASGRVYGGRLSEQRYAPSAVNNAAEPARYDEMGAEVSGTIRRDRIQLQASVGTEQEDWDAVPLIPDPLNPGGPTSVSNDFRDVTENSVYTRASYAVSPDIAIFAQARATELDYDLATDPAGFNRDATRLNGQVGASFELAAPFRGDIAVGYIHENKYDSALENTDGLSVDGELLWFPTQLTTVTVDGRRTIYDPGLTGSSSAILTQFGGRVDHELRRNWVVFGEASTSTTDFKGGVPGLAPGSVVPIDREDQIVSFGGGLGYKLNRNARINATYTFRTQDSSGVNSGREFDQNILGVELRVYP